MRLAGNDKYRFGKIGTSAEHPLTNACHTGAYGDFCQLITAADQYAVEGCDTVRKAKLFKICTIVKDAVTDRGHAVRHSHVYQTGTTAKSACAKALNSANPVDICQRRTILEHIIADRFARECTALQIGRALKRIAADRGDRIGKIDIFHTDFRERVRADTGYAVRELNLLHVFHIPEGISTYARYTVLEHELFDRTEDSAPFRHITRSIIIHSALSRTAFNTLRLREHSACVVITCVPYHTIVRIPP